MPSDQTVDEYRVVSIIPSHVLKTMDNSKGEESARLAATSNARNASYLQYKPADIISLNDADQRKSNGMTGKKYISVDYQTDYHTKTKAHHVFYTKSAAGTFYSKAEESPVNEYTAKQKYKTGSGNEGLARNSTDKISKKPSEVDKGIMFWKADVEIHRKKDKIYRQDSLKVNKKSNEHQNFNINTDIKLIQGNGNWNVTLKNGSLVAETSLRNDETDMNFMVEADKLIKKYKKKYGSPENLEESSGDEFEKRLNNTRINEMLSDKDVIITKADKAEQIINKRSSGKAAKINRKDACFNCGDSVYQKEKIGPIRAVLFHSYCFKCFSCGTVLNLNNYYQNHKDMYDRSVYCKSHQPSPEISKGDIADKSIQAIINKPKLQRVSSNVRAGTDSKGSIGADSLSIKSAMNAPKLGTYNSNVRVTSHCGVTDHTESKALFVQTAVNATEEQKNHTPDNYQQNITNIPGAPVYHGFNALHSLYLHKP